MLPLIVPETNILLDIWLGRRESVAELFLDLAENDQVALTIPEYALLEFRGTAQKWLRTSRRQLEDTWIPVKTWCRTTPLGETADDIKERLHIIKSDFDKLEEEIENLVARFNSCATVVPHSQRIHFRGEKRFLAGEPPGRPRESLKDCRIYEAVLAIAKEDVGNKRPLKVFATRDDDFKDSSIIGELDAVGFELRQEMGRLYGEVMTL